MAVADAVARRDLLDQRDARRRASSPGRSPKSAGVPSSGLGEMPYIAMPGPYEVEVRLGEGERRRGVGDVPHLGLDALPSRRTPPSRGSRSSWAAIEGWPGLVGAGEVRPEAGDLDRARRPRRRSAAATSSGQSAGWQPLRPRPVSALSWIRAGRPACAGRGGDLAQRPHPAHRHVEVGLDAPRARARPASTASTSPGPGCPAARSASASCGRGGAEPGRAGLERGPGAGHRAVAVRVRLHHGHQRRPAARGRAARARWPAGRRGRSRHGLARGGVSLIAPSVSEPYDSVSYNEVRATDERLRATSRRGRLHRRSRRASPPAGRRPSAPAADVRRRQSAATSRQAAGSACRHLVRRDRRALRRRAARRQAVQIGRHRPRVRAPSGPRPAASPPGRTARRRCPPWPATACPSGSPGPGPAAVRRGDQRRRALEQHRRPVPRGQFAYGGEPRRLHLLARHAQQRRRLPRVRGQQGRRASGPVPPRASSSRSPSASTSTGTSEASTSRHRRRRRRRAPARRPTPAPVPPSTAAPRRTRVSGNRAITASAAGPDVPHRPRAAAQRARHGEHRRARVARGPGDDADDAPPVLVALRGRHRQQPRHVRVLERLQVGHGRQWSSSPMSTSRTAPAYSRAGSISSPGLYVPKVTVDVGAQRLAPHLPGVRLDAARQVDGDDHGVGPARRPRHRHRVRPQPAAPADPGDAVQDQVGGGQHARTGPSRDPPARRRSSAASPPSCVRSGPSSTAVDPAPRRASRAPAYSASPPLSPLPTSSTTRAPYTRPSSRHRRRRARRRPAA